MSPPGRPPAAARRMRGGLAHHAPPVPWPAWTQPFPCDKYSEGARAVNLEDRCPPARNSCRAGTTWNREGAAP
eukprot:4010620-Pyramimonas_sp.AAC.1